MHDGQRTVLTNWDIVVVTYNSARALSEVWGTVPEEVRNRVICVDNSSTDDTAEVARTLFPTVLRSANMGLSIANNLGAAAGTSPYVLFANPDVAPQPSDFARLSSHLDTHGGLVSPRLIGDDGSPQENARGWPVLLSQLTNRLSERRSHGYRWPLAPGTDGPVPWILGAAVAVRRHDFEKIGGWPEEYFLYYEDVELCMRAWNCGMPVWLLGSMEWHHQWARSSRSYLGKSARLHARSATRFFRTRPGFIFRAPSRFAEEHSSRLASPTRQQDWTSVDLVVRSDATEKHGGDLVQAERYCDDLTRLGIDARIVPFRIDFAPREDALVHFFNIDRPWEFLFAARTLDLKRIVVSTIHHSASLTSRMRQAEARSSGLGSLAARLPANAREAILFALRCMSTKDVAFSKRLTSALWATSQVVRVRRHQVGRVLERCRAVLVLSNRELEDLKHDTGYRGLNHILVPNGLEVAAQGGIGWAERPARILVVGRVEPRKRQAEIVDAANRLGIKLTFVGAANSKRDGYVRRFQEALRQGPSEWLGTLPHSDVLELMGRSRVLLNLSWLEVQSLVDLEGAAMGCSLVVSAAGSTKEWLGDVVVEFPVGELDGPLLVAQDLAHEKAGPSPINYSQTWEAAAQQLVEIYSLARPTRGLGSS